MAETVDEKEAAKRLGVSVEEVVYRLEYGQMMGTPTDAGWQIDTRDIDFFANGERIEQEIVAANRAHPGRGWRLGNCVVCQTMMAQPTQPHEKWVCSEACLATAPDGAELRPAFQGGR